MTSNARSRIGGPIDYAALAASADSGDEARMCAFDWLTRDEQAAAIRRMAAEGHTEATIASATHLSVEFVKRVLGRTE